MFNENGHNSTYWNTNNSSTLTSAKSYIPENVWNETCTTQCPAQAAPWRRVVAGPAYSSPSLPGSLVSRAFRMTAHEIFPTSRSRQRATILTCCALKAHVKPPASSGSRVPRLRRLLLRMITLVDQKMGSRQGQANYVLYRLAVAETLSQCNGSKTTGLPASSCVFNDVTVGNNAVPGEAGFGTAGAKYQSSLGFDLASGWAR